MRNIHRGFTVIELLAATALATVLMVAVLGSMGTLAVKSRAISELVVDGWQRRLTEQLLWDLSNARYMKREPGRLTLVGFGAIDSESMRVRHRRVEVVYELQSDANSTWLTRYQTSVNGETDELWRGDVVCADISSFRIETIGDELVGAESSIPIPTRVRIVLAGNDSDPPILDRTLYVR